MAILCGLLIAMVGERYRPAQFTLHNAPVLCAKHAYAKYTVHMNSRPFSPDLCTVKAIGIITLSCQEYKFSMG
jgi:hypothetical protein